MNDETVRRLRASNEYQRALQLGIDVLSGRIPANDAEMMRAIDRLIAMSDNGSAFDLELTDQDRDFLRTNRIQP